VLCRKVPILLAYIASFATGMGRTLQRLEYAFIFIVLKAFEIHLSRSSADFDGHCGPHNLRRVSL